LGGLVFFPTLSKLVIINGGFRKGKCAGCLMKWGEFLSKGKNSLLLAPLHKTILRLQISSVCPGIFLFKINIGFYLDKYFIRLYDYYREEGENFRSFVI